MGVSLRKSEEDAAIVTPTSLFLSNAIMDNSNIKSTGTLPIFRLITGTQYQASSPVLEAKGNLTGHVHRFIITCQIFCFPAVLEIVNCFIPLPFLLPKPLAQSPVLRIFQDAT